MVLDGKTPYLPMTTKEMAKRILLEVCNSLENPSFQDEAEIIDAIALIIGHEKQEWNRRCNEACEKQVNKAVAAALQNKTLPG